MQTSRLVTRAAAAMAMAYAPPAAAPQTSASRPRHLRGRQGRDALQVWAPTPPAVSPRHRAAALARAMQGRRARPQTPRQQARLRPRQRRAR
eukprot:359587-Chlamydomonas_euryale.AAC.1